MSDLDSALESTARGATILFIGLFLSKLLTYGYRLVTARIGTTDYGLVSLGLVIVGIFGTFAMLGTNIGVHRYVAFFHARKEETKVKGTLLAASYVTLALSIIFTVFTFVFASYMSIHFFNSKDLIPVLKIMSLSIPFFAFSTLFMFALQAFNRSDYSTYGKYITEGAVKLIAAVVLIYLGYELIGATWAYTISLIVATVVLLFFLNKTFPLLSKIKAEYNYRELLTFSWPLVLSSIFWIMLSYIDTLMLGFLRPASDVGIYSASAPTSYLLLTFPITFSLIFLPVITMLYSQKKYEDMRKIAKVITKWNLLFLVPLFLILLLFSKDILRILFGADYVSGALSLIILSSGFLIYGWLSFNTELLKLIKKTKLIVMITVLSMLLNIILCLILIKGYGINGAAIATTVSFFVYSILITFFTIKLIKFNIVTYKNALIFVAGIIPAVLVWFLFRFKDILAQYLPYIIVLVLYAAIYAGIFWFILYMTKIMDKEDLVFIRIVEKKTKLNLSWVDDLFIKK